MKKIHLYSIIAVVIILVIAGAFVLFSDNPISNKVSPISVIKYSDENSTFTITKYNIDKTAKVSMEFYMASEDLHPDFFGEKGDLTELMTGMTCGMMQMAFFNQTALNEFEAEIQKWNSMDGVVEDDTGKEIGTPEGNPLEGYKVTQFNFYLKEKETRNTLSDCVVTGASEEDIKINYS